MRLLSFDLEMNQPSNRIIQIGAVVFEADTGEIIHKYESFIDPGEPIIPYITELTGITDADVKGAPKVLDVYLHLKEIHTKYKCFVNPVLWGSGTRSDSSALYEQSGIKESNFMGHRVIDAKTLYQSMRLFQGKKVRGGLKDSCNSLNLGFEGTEHTALSDALNTARIWFHLAQMFK